ncbi:SIMPL domain-containing protein [Saccharopolyspora erythraea]|uniref:SIMPL domain-containing protein n=1 Tax=Saccharopolyspora erythraea TaxID=1836 RepID=UPI001BA9C3B7|nr:SIMPL domain-containing protein [Saccharopolyspora erythraea]QUH05595.1 SIMPL domain-containing protein [Saccharopolyspora erythraea]
MAEVVTNGNGQVLRTADRATLTVAFSASAPERAQAVDVLADRVSGIEELLSTVEVRSRNLTVHPTYEDGHQVGCQARQHYTLRVGGREELERLAGALLEAEPERLDGPRWELSDQAEAAAEAQRRAVADARRRAEAYADALGRALGPLVRLVDGGAERRGPSAPALGGAAAPGARSAAESVRALDLAPGHVSVTASCTVTWALD